MGASRVTSHRPPRLLMVVVVVVLAWLLAGADCGFPRFDAHPGGPSHSLSVEHPRLSDGSAASCASTLATAVIARPATALAVLGIAPVALALTGRLAGLRSTALRGPPSGSVYPFTSVLTQLCVARR
ncbi:hypothetical protein [Mycobacterium malmoense]|uniref:hypothetical protein n=1 Tax=Mycobacterium malmoense TaxID=1780 RepID=UPI00114D4B4E|nr:hypothetical protein [Mycobacterium malmoense]